MTALEIRLIGIALAVVALLCGYGWWHHHVEQAGRDAAQQEQREADARQSAANQAARDAQAKTQQENANEATRFDTARADAARGLDAAVQRLHDRYPVRAAAVASPGSAAASDAGGVSSPAMVPAELYFRAVDAAVDLAKYADCLRTGGELCARDYQALKAP